MISEVILLSNNYMDPTLKTQELTQRTPVHRNFHGIDLFLRQLYRHTLASLNLSTMPTVCSGRMYPDVGADVGADVGVERLSVVL